MDGKTVRLDVSLWTSLRVLAISACAISLLPVASATSAAGHLQNAVTAYPATAQREIEGEVQVRYEDHRAGGQLRHDLRTASGWIPLRFSGRVPQLSSGARVQLTGREVEGSIVVTADALILGAEGGTVGGSSVAGADMTGTLGEQPTLVLLVNFPENSSEPWTVEQIRSVVFGSVSDFFRENSYGSTSLTGEVHGWFTVPLSTVNGRCFFPGIADAVDQAATDAGINLAAFSRILYFFPSLPDCNTAGAGTIGGTPSRAWIHGAPLDDEMPELIAHEMGHNFGLYHAPSWDCGGVPIGLSCSSAEYGDTYDVMGNPDLGHFNAIHKERLGWLNATAGVMEITADGTYSIDAFETTSAGPKTLKISRGTDPVSGQPTWLYLEYRQALGFDSFLAGRSYRLYRSDVTHGVVVHFAEDGNPDRSQLLHMNLATPYRDIYGSPDWFDPALPVGSSYFDHESGITITPESANGLTAVVRVRVPVGVSQSGENQPPVAVDDYAEVSDNRDATIRVLDNDSDPEGEAIFLTGVTQGTRGTAAINADGTITYRPDPKAKGSDEVVYTISDGLASAHATLTVKILRSKGRR